MPSLLHDNENEQYVKIVWETFDSLRGRRLKGKGKGVLGARETRGVPRVSLAPFSLPFQTPATQFRRLIAFDLVKSSVAE